MESRSEGTGPRGRRKSVLDSLRGGKSYIQLKRSTQDKRTWQETDPRVDLPLARALDEDSDTK